MNSDAYNISIHSPSIHIAMVEFSYKRRNKQAEARSAPPTRVQPERAYPNPAGNPASVNRKVCFSFAAYACTVIAHLSKCNVPITKGLSEEEFHHIQSKFGFEFPPDLRSILQEGLPVGAGFPNWRASSDKQLLNMLNLPAKGLCHEVSKGTFWCKHWGSRPDRTDDAVCIARTAFKMAPVLVPIYSYCYIPCFPDLSGNPIFFVFEKDVFYCGYDLADFFEREIFIPLMSSSKSSKRPECGEATMLGSRPKRGSRREKQKNMSSISENMVMESKLRAYYDKDDGPLHHGDTHGGHHHSQNCGDDQDFLNHRHHPHHQSSKEDDWEILNQRLLTELQNVDVKDQWLHGREGDEHGAAHGEVLSRKSMSEEPLRPFERPPKSLVRSAGNSPRMGQSIMSRYTYFYEKPLPARVLSQFTIAAPPWAAKMARHIPMWSDLVENKENLHDANIAKVCISADRSGTFAQPSLPLRAGEAGGGEQVKRNIPKQTDVVESKESLCDSNVVQSERSSCDMNVVKSKECFQSNGALMQEFEFDVELPEYVKSQGEQREYAKSQGGRRESAKSQEEQGARVRSGKPSKRWLVPYFKDMEKRLRRGGWKEDEIEEMMVAALFTDELFRDKQTRREIQDILGTTANALSVSLQKAGWSEPDVSDILSLDLKHPYGMHASDEINYAKANLISDLKADKKVAGKLSDFLTVA
eukprot:c24083_g2_i1 orf=614-2707(-)